MPAVSAEENAPAPGGAAAAGPVLALDTTGALGSVAVWFTGSEAGADAAVVETFGPSNRHAAQLLPAIRRALDRAGVGPGDLLLLAATRGPGSFTGLRVGLATVQGLSLGSGIPAVGVSSLDAAALADHLESALPNDRSTPRLSTVDALRGELFAAAYERPDSPAAAGPVRLAPREAGRWARERNLGRICGPGAARYREEIAAGIGSGTPRAAAGGMGDDREHDEFGNRPPGITIASDPIPLAPAAARLGFHAFHRGVSDLSPFYLRDPDIHR